MWLFCYFLASGIGSAWADTKVPSPVVLPLLHVVHIIPGDASNYTVTREINDLETSSRFAVNAYLRKFPTCKVESKFSIRRGSEHELYQEVKATAAERRPTVAVGFSRSGLARIAAKAAQGTSLIGLSIGASTDDLNSINPRFASMATSWKEQWRAIAAALKSAKCSAQNTLVISDTKDSYSFNFAQSAHGNGFTKGADPSSSVFRNKFADLLEGTSCIFVAMNMSTSQPVLEKLISIDWPGQVYGTGDWYFYRDELKKVVNDMKRSSRLRIAIPTGWKPNLTPSSKRIVSALRSALNHEPEPNSIYTYDAIQIALDHICHGSKNQFLDVQKIKKLDLSRKYMALAESGNFVSPTYLVDYDGR